MENLKSYSELHERLSYMIKTARKLGLNVRPGGGYVDSSYSINNMPDYTVGLFGALSIVFGPDIRSRLGLSYEESQSLEVGFNNGKSFNKLKTPKRIKLNQELINIGTSLANIVFKRRIEWGDIQPLKKIKTNPIWEIEDIAINLNDNLAQPANNDGEDEAP